MCVDVGVDVSFYVKGFVFFECVCVSMSMSASMSVSVSVSMSMLNSVTLCVCFFDCFYLGR